MLNIALHAAVITLLLQGFLFPLLMLMSFYWMWRAHDEKSKTKKKKQIALVKEDVKKLPTLRPLKCASCGAGVPLREGEMKCLNCGAAVALPPHYADIGRLRSEARERLRRAARYLRRAKLFSSNAVRRTLFLLALWLFVTPFFLIIAGGEFRFYDPFIESLGLWFHFSFGSLILWIIILCFTAGMMSNVRQDLPEIEGEEKLAKRRRRSAGCAAAQSLTGAATWRPSAAIAEWKLTECASLGSRENVPSSEEKKRASRSSSGASRQRHD